MSIAPGGTAGLRAYQDAFADALLAPDGTPNASPLLVQLVAQPGFAVYRNTVMKGCIDALQANYPAVSRLVGDAWFRAAALLYVKGHLPAHPSLLDYGSDAAEIAWVGEEHGFDNFLRILARRTPVVVRVKFLPPLQGPELENRKTIAQASREAVLRGLGAA